MNLFLPGVPEHEVACALNKSPGDELNSGKFSSPASSAALAVNGFGYFLDRPSSLPPFPALATLDWPATRVDIERQMRFPWRGGRHPWLDAAVETPNVLIGVESKRYEPFRDSKVASFSAAYDRDVWGKGMQPWCRLRDSLKADPRRFRHVDAAQLVKHAFGLFAEGSRTGKRPVLLYLFAEPADLTAASKAVLHRWEINALAQEVRGAGVEFAAQSWRGWLETFAGEARSHALRMSAVFAP